MEEYADIYYVDDGRNAVVRDHRHRPGVPSWIPRPPVYRPPVRHHHVAPAAVQQPIAYAQPQLLAQPQLFPQAQLMYPPQPLPQSTAASILGKLTTGQIVEMIAQAFAAMQALPGAPVATRDTSTDVANLILFQNALAQHAKRDEQVRTLGSLVAKLVG